MCGIVGYWDFHPGHDLATIRRMTTRLSHRGPNHGGYFCDKKTGLFLGHRRLAIVDLSERGQQPMTCPSGRWTLIYNGEIYNHTEIRRHLSQYPFQSNTDTETLLAACLTWGLERTLHHCVGMFAFALFDAQEQQLYLVRDRLGIKPLYWGWQHNRFFFSSELKAFYPHPHWNPALDPKALQSFLAFNYIPAPACIFAGFEKLRPGHYLVIDRHRRQSQHCYWSPVDYCTEDNRTPSREESLHEIQELLTRSVKRCLLADVDVGAFLSGGIDSSAIVSLMQASRQRSVKTFTIGFADQAFNEATYARQVANHLGTDHHELFVTASVAQQVIPNLPTYYDEPFADSSQIPTVLVSKLAGEHVRVVLTGDGGDEVFAGYTRYLFTHKLFRYLTLCPQALKGLLQNILGLILKKKWHLVYRFLPFIRHIPHFTHKMTTLHRIMNCTSLQSLYLDIIRLWPQAVSAHSFDSTKLPVKSSLSSVGHLQLWDLQTYLPDDILTKTDRATMAYHVEARLPLLDHQLIEYVARLPLNHKLYEGQTKWPLRQICQTYLPEQLFTRPKMGFGIPIHSWLRQELRDWSDTLLSTLTSEEGLNVDLIRQRYQDHQDQRSDSGYALWGVLMYLAWRQHHTQQLFEQKRPDDIEPIRA